MRFNEFKQVETKVIAESKGFFGRNAGDKFTHQDGREYAIVQVVAYPDAQTQKFETRMFRIFRNVFKYGDAIFLRDPETKKWFHVDPAKLKRIIVNESEGKQPEQYIIKDII